jgi:hypothetical protein
VAAVDELRAPTIDDVRAAAARIAPHVRPTPFEEYAGLSELVGAEVWVKPRTGSRPAPSRCAAASTSWRSSTTTSAPAG